MTSSRNNVLVYSTCVIYYSSYPFYNWGSGIITIIGIVSTNTCTVHVMMPSHKFTIGSFKWEQKLN